MSQTQILAKAFESGKTLTARQIRGVYKIKSPAKVVSRLRRNAGLPVLFKNGAFVLAPNKVKYPVIVKGYEAVLGAPSARVLAAGFRAVGV